MGDIALTLPVLYQLLQEYPKLEVTYLTKVPFALLFSSHPRLKVLQFDLNREYKGLGGLFRLSRHIKQDFSILIDWHDHLRTTVLKIFLYKPGLKICTINKGRAQKKSLTRKGLKKEQLKHTTIRYAETLARAGLTLTLTGPEINAKSIAPRKGSAVVEDFIESFQGKKLVGIAPFAKHQTKIWGENKVKELIASFPQDSNIHFLLFGGGKDEIKKLYHIKSSFEDQVTVCSHLFDLTDELYLMTKLRAMVSMDSANMHLASLAGVPVVSVWGGTHPYAGFYPINNNRQNIIQISLEELDCRPCSIFGKTTCYRGDFACMNRISPETVKDRLMDILH